MTQMRKLEEQVGAWPHVSVHPHRFGGREFRIGNAELGHLHIGGTVDIPFPRAVRDALLADGLAEEHRWVPIQGGLRFTSEVKETSSMRSGSCGCHICAMRSGRPATLAGCWSTRASH
jgi:hypothetical protein